MGDFNKNELLAKRPEDLATLRERFGLPNATEAELDAKYYESLCDRNAVGIPQDNMVPEGVTLMIDDFTGRTLTPQDIAKCFRPQSMKVKDKDGNDEVRHYDAFSVRDENGVLYNMPLTSFTVKVKDLEGSIHQPKFNGAYDAQALAGLGVRQGGLKAQMENFAKLFSNKKVTLVAKRIVDSQKGKTPTGANRTTAVCEFTFA